MTVLLSGEEGSLSIAARSMRGGPGMEGGAPAGALGLWDLGEKADA